MQTAGINDISPNAIKALNVEIKSTLFDNCVNYLHGEVNIEEWQRGSLQILLQKGDIPNPNI